MSSIQIIALFAFACLIAQPAFGSRAHNGFFQGLSEDQKEQVSTILNGGLSKAEIKEQLGHWISSQPKATQEAFQAAENSQSKRKALVLARHQQRLSKVSSVAKELDAQIKSVFQNQTLTKQQTCEQVQALIKGASEEAKKELNLKEKSCDE